MSSEEVMKLVERLATGEHKSWVVVRIDGMDVESKGVCRLLLRPSEKGDRELITVPCRRVEHFGQGDHLIIEKRDKPTPTGNEYFGCCEASQFLDFKLVQ